MPSGGMAFEAEVRAVARAMWQLPIDQGGPEEVAGQEIDCVCRTEDVTYLIMCTSDRRLEKVTKDVSKLNAAKPVVEREGRAVSMWLVTKYEPTADQAQAARPHGIRLLSLERFTSRLIDARDYYETRWSYRFGSARDPGTDAVILKDDEYVELPIVDRSGKPYRVADLVEGLSAGQSFILLGPFGAGKSLTVREMFREFRRRYFVKHQPHIVTALNLRDHWEQPSTDEALRRHAAKIGFAQPHQLVRAWNAGRLIALLDGFDELATRSWRLGREAVRWARKEALAIVRQFFQEGRGRTGVLVTGRDHYFDNDDEMLVALDPPANVTVLTVGEFTEEQAREYLRRRGKEVPLPTWMPRKPLLLSYLVVRDFLNDVLSVEGDLGPALAWDKFLELACNREARLADDIDGASVRQVLEKLALRARTSASGLGPLYDKDMDEIYNDVTGVNPQEAGRVMLRRLPALTSRDQEEGARSFIDREMLHALWGSAVAKFISAPYTWSMSAPWLHGQSELGIAVTATVAEKLGVKTGQYIVAAREAVSRWNEPSLAADALFAGALNTQGALSCEGLVLRHAMIGPMDMAEVSFKDLELDGCAIDEVDISEPRDDLRLRFSECNIGHVIGAASADGLPKWFVHCDVDRFESSDTTAGIMASDAPLAVRVGLTVLRKLFLQRGRGRQESAFRRGIGQSGVAYVEPVLALVRSEGLAFPSRESGKTVWHPIRSATARVRSILAQGIRSDDSLMTKVRGMK